MTSLLLHQPAADPTSTPSRQIPHPDLPQRRSERQDHRSQVNDQIPAEEGAVLGRCGRECRYDGGRADIEHHVGHQLSSQLIKERVAECGQLDG